MPAGSLRRVVRADTREVVSTAAPENWNNAIDTFIERRNHEPKSFIWTKTADQILATLARSCERTADSGH